MGLYDEIPKIYKGIPGPPRVADDPEPDQYGARRYGSNVRTYRVNFGGTIERFDDLRAAIDRARQLYDADVLAARRRGEPQRAHGCIYSIGARRGYRVGTDERIVARFGGPFRDLALRTAEDRERAIRATVGATRRKATVGKAANAGRPKRRRDREPGRPSAEQTGNSGKTSARSADK